MTPDKLGLLRQYVERHQSSFIRGLRGYASMLGESAELMPRLGGATMSAEEFVVAREKRREAGIPESKAPELLDRAVAWYMDELVEPARGTSAKAKTEEAPVSADASTQPRRTLLDRVSSTLSLKK